MQRLAPLAALAACALPLCAQSLTTTFASTNGGSSGWVVMFDATVAPTLPQGLRITALDVNCSSATSVPITVNLWFTPSTYVGVERNASAWIKVATGTGMSAPRNSPTPVDISDWVLPAGTNGLAVQVVGSGVAYTDGNGTNQNYFDANLSLQLGAALASEFLSTGLLFTPRVWNGTIHYATAGTAAYGVFGEGCLGSNGIPRLAPSTNSVPSIGSALTLNVTNGPLATTPATMMLGFDKSRALGLPLPIDLSPIGMTGCQLRINPLLYSGIPLVNGSGTYSLPIPNDPTLFGLAMYHQALVVDIPANTLGLTTTNAGEGVIGR